MIFRIESQRDGQILAQGEGVSRNPGEELEGS